MTTPELPPLPDRLRVYTIDGTKYVDGGAFSDWFDIQVERERILLARIAELHKDLADCFRLTGADPDGNEDWRLSRDAVKEVAAMRTDLDLAETRIAELEADAARYRWLRTATYLGGETLAVFVIDEASEIANKGEWLSDEQLDAAIDAARGKE